MLSSYAQLLSAFKQAANEANNATQPVTICFGVVTSEAPLTITIDQKFELSGEDLILARNVTDYNTDETVDHLTENRAGGSGDPAFESHNHNYKGRKTFLIHHKLLVGDKVLMLREQGGQRYVVLDRVVM